MAQLENEFGDNFSLRTTKGRCEFAMLDNDEGFSVTLPDGDQINIKYDHPESVSWLQTKGELIDKEFLIEISKAVESKYM